MQLIKSLFKFYVFANIHVALAGFCLAEITVINFNLKSGLASYFVAFSIVISYNFIRYYEIKNNSILWFTDWFYSNLKAIFVLTIVAVISLCLMVFFSDFNKKSLLIVIPFGIITLFYVVPFFKIGQNNFSFRNFPSIKIFSIAVSWAGITVFFPFAENDMAFSPFMVLIFLQRFIFVLIWTIPFDIRDVRADEHTLKTLPQLLGVFKTKVLATFLLIGFLFFEIILNGLKSTNFTITIFISTLLLVSVWLASEKKNRMFTAFWVESLPIIWLALVLILKN